MTEHLWLNALIVLGIIGGAEETLRRLVVRPMLRAWRKTERFLDTWNGEAARDGLPARPGLVERVIAIEAQVHNNGGSSMRDAVDRIERTGEETARSLQEHITDSKTLIEKGAEAEAEIRTAVANLAAAIPVIAASTPPEESS